MKIKEISGLIADKIIVYKQVADSLVFNDLYKGYSAGIPKNIANLEIENIGAAKKGIVDIQVKIKI